MENRRINIMQPVMKIARLILIQVLISSFYCSYSQTLECNQPAYEDIYYICEDDTLNFSLEVCDTCTLSEIVWSSNGNVISQNQYFNTNAPGSYQVIFTVEIGSGTESVSDTLNIELAQLNNQFTANACIGQIINLSEIVYPELFDDLEWIGVADSTVTASTDSNYVTGITNLLGCEVSFSVNLHVLDPGTIEPLVVYCYGDEWNLLSTDAPSSNSAQSIYWQGSSDSLSWTSLEVNSLDFNSGSLPTAIEFLRRVVAVDTLNCPSNPSKIVPLGEDTVKVIVAAQLTLCPGDTLSLNPEGCETYLYVDNMNPGTVINEDMIITVVGSNFFNYQETIFACSDTVEVQIDIPSFNPGLISGSQLLCVDEPISPFESVVDASSQDELTLQWQQSLDGVYWSDIEGALDQEYSLNTVASVNSSFRRLANTTITYQDTLQLECQSPSNIVFVSVPNQAVTVEGPVGEICGNSYYVPVRANASDCSFDWTISGGSIMANSNQDDEVFLHLQTDDSCNVEVQIVHLQSGCEQIVNYTIYVSSDLALDTVPVFIIDQSAHLVGIEPNTQAQNISWGYSTLDGFEVESNISNFPYCYFPNFNTDNFIYWVDLTSDDGCNTRSYLNFNRLQTSFSEVVDGYLMGFPNPFDRAHYIRNPSGTSWNVSVFNCLGEQLESLSVLPNDSVWVGNNLPNGQYIVRLMDGEGKVYSYPIIKL